MKSLYYEAADAFVRYFDLPAKDDSQAVARIYLAGLGTPATACFLDVATHPRICGRRSLLIDYLGCGFSDKAHQFDHSMTQHAKVIAQVLDHEGLSACEIIGHSMGGTIGIHLALMRPDLVSRLVICESNLEAGGGAGTRYIASFSEGDWLYNQYPAYMTDERRKAREGNATAAFNAGAWEASDPLAIYLQSRALVNLSEQFTQQFYQLPLPVTFIYGDANLPCHNDGVALPDAPHPERLTAQGFHYEVVEGSGHWMMIDNLDGFAAAIAAGLAYERQAQS